MQDAADTRNPSPPARILGWRRVRVIVISAVLVSLIMLPSWKVSYALLLGRLLFVGLIGLLLFGLFERWPKRLPRWLARWALQIVAIAIAMPFATALAYAFTTLGEPGHWWRNEDRMAGYSFMTVLSLLSAPWIAMSALYRHISGQARSQALAFELERSEFERQALDARLRLLQAQVEPHFLFNTLANVRELVDSGSPQASGVLANLIAYLRAAVPRLQDSVSTLAQELDLVRAYLEVMHMRMPDRLQFTLQADDAALALHCPPMTLLTLVENAVRHGIDPSETGGRIEVRVSVRDGRCRAEVIDTGVGLGSSQSGLSTGLSNLRERLRAFFGDDVRLELAAHAPQGACATVEFPARSGSA